MLLVLRGQSQRQNMVKSQTEKYIALFQSTRHARANGHPDGVRM